MQVTNSEAPSQKEDSACQLPQKGNLLSQQTGHGAKNVYFLINVACKFKPVPAFDVIRQAGWFVSEQ